MPRIRSTHRLFRLAALVVAALLTAASPSLANRAPDRGALPASLQALSAPDLASESFRPIRMEGGVQRQYGASSELLRRYWLRVPAALPTSATPPRAIAERFLADHAAELGLAGGRIDESLSFESAKDSPSGSHFRWQQIAGGVPVYRSEIVVKVSKLGQVSSVQNNLKPGLSLATVPSIGREQAIETGKGIVQPTGKAIGDFTADLRVVALAGGPRLAYLVHVPVEAPMGDWVVFVDAKTGAAFGVEDRMAYATGTGRVFDPDPMSKTNDSTLVDLADADTAVPFATAYDIKPLQGITLNAGTYSLDGPYARLIDNESPTVAPVTATQPDSFRYQRSPSGFEDVNTYFQIDFSQRYVQSLGFLNVNNRVQQIDSHGLSGADNSHYVPSTGNLAFGEGGIDDAEDADVIWHEYGHSIQDNIVPGWGGGQEGAMGEGFGDYWAGSYSRSLFPLFQFNRVFTWDGNGETWTGRLLIDTALHYPENCCGEVHDSGTLWCSGLTDCWNSLGRAVMDKLVLDHHFALGTSATMADAAGQIIQSDIDLFGGAHVGTLVAKLGFWGFVDPADFVPTITHTPLTDTENSTGPYAVIANVTSTQPLTGDSPKLLWGVGASITDSTVMTPTGNPNEFSANIPGPGGAADIRYYLRAADTNGGVSFHPVGAPGNLHLFHVGPDVTAPVITHAPFGNVPKISWPVSVNATVTDNLGVNTSSVTVAWTLNAVPKTAFTLTRIGLTSNYTGAFPSPNSEVNPGDAVTYHITAADVASTPNTARHPAVGEHSFTITAALGTVLVLDDDELAAHTSSKTLPVEGRKGETVVVEQTAVPGDVTISSANAIAGILNGLGYVATVEPAATSSPASWPSYGFIVSSSGGNEGPVASAPYRTAIESYVASGGKLLVEGGEVVYDASTSPLYPTFAANVLHSTDWDADNAGSLQKLAAQTSHPIANLPNVLPSTIPIAYTGFGSEDSYKPNAPAYIVYGVTAQPGNGGILVYDNNASPVSAQVVVFGFDFKDLGDLATQSALLQNTAAYLTASEGSPTGSISGRVSLGSNNNGAGVTVTAQPGGQAAVTNANGFYTIPNMYGTTYGVTASKAGYQSATVGGVVVTQGQDTPNVNLHLFPQPATNACIQPGLAIPDNVPAGVTSDIVIGDVYNVAGVTVDVNLTHTYIGDLIVELRHGAKTVRLHNRTGGSSDNIIGNYPGTLTVGGPGALSNFTGDPVNGTWTLFISDNEGLDIGTLNQWCLHLTGPADSSQVVGVGSSDTPIAIEFAPPRPNPSRGEPTTMSFALPSSGRVTLAIYDVGGRLVRSLADRTFEAGRHAVAWDGRDGRGAPVGPGVYLARFSSGGRELSRRFVMIQ